VSSDPGEGTGYRIAVGAIGVALIVVLIGICVIVAVGEGKEIPVELWTITSALGGGLLGLLAPSPTPTSAPTVAPVEGFWSGLGRGLTVFGKDLWENRSVVILLIIFAASVTLGATKDSSQFQALAAASGGALIGLLAPAGKSQADQ
jgi:hypothetical protein